MSSLPSPHSGDPSRYALRIVGVKEGEAKFVRMIASSYGGCMTHWNGARSIWCPGEKCRASQHGKAVQWKGYTAAEMYDQALGLWAPIAFEMTENLEVDFRGLFARGQVWLVTREKPTDAKKPKCRGELHETVPESELVEPFEVLNCVRATYHAYDLLLNVRNPMPARTLVSAVPGAPPAALTGKVEAAATNWRDDPELVARLTALQDRNRLGSS